MQITKYGHACVRVAVGDAALVIDPGVLTEAEAIDGATAILVTHEHDDHYSLAHLRATGAPIYTIEAVADRIVREDSALESRVHVVVPGECVDLGACVQVIGQQHAVIHPTLPRFDNSGYLIKAEGTTFFHPGDAFTDPGEDVDVLCLPVSAPWAKLSEVMDYASEVSASRTLAIHDQVYSEFGLGIVDARVAAHLGNDCTYARLAPGTQL